MKLFIWKKTGARDFEEIEVEVTRIFDKGIKILHEGKEIELKWEEEYSLRDLKAGKSILIYIFDGDFSRAYVLPHVRNPSLQSLDSVDVYRSIIDKMNDHFKKKKQEYIKLLEINASTLSDKAIEDIVAVKNKLKGSIQDRNISDQIKSLIDEHKLKNDQ